ncbi:MAG: hypothetical protein KY445_04270 [Armatimonadetes bacterium]|nr:hypothetical protein [Armatimonadota bacterium]
MDQRDNNIGSGISSEDNPARHFSKWWFVIMALLFGFIFQIAATSPFNHIISEGNSRAVLVIDTFILIRAIVGLIWQPHSSDWKWYLAFFPVSIPLIWFLVSLGGALTR